MKELILIFLFIFGMSTLAMVAPISQTNPTKSIEWFIAGFIMILPSGINEFYKLIKENETKRKSKRIN